jgi:hypothetical protein
MRLKFLFILLIGLFSIQTLHAQQGELSGTVTDARTGEPLIGATVLLEGTTIGDATDANGRYFIDNIPADSYNITVSFVGFTSVTKFNIVIRSEGNIDINFELQEDAQLLGEVVVTPNPFEKLQTTPLSIQNLSQEEVAAYPGGNNDIAKVVQTLPGVGGTVGGFRNDVIIRGGAPNENVYYLDGIEIPNINHFSTQGSAGGPVGLLNVSFFEGVTLSASSFDAQYDNVLSGVLQFDQRNGNARHFQGNFRLGSSESAFTVEGPLFKGENEESNTTYIASVRRSYLQLIFEAIGLPILPDYWDYQYKVNHQIDQYNSLLITGLGSIDDFAVNPLDEFDPQEQAVQEQVPVIKQRTNTIGATWSRRFKDRSGNLRLTLSTNRLENEFSQFTDNVNEQGLYFQNDASEQEVKLRLNVMKFFGDWITSYGGSLQNADYSNATTDVVNNANFSADINFYRYGAFVQTSRSFSDRTTFSFGLRVDGNSFMDSGNEIWKTLSPRISKSFKITEDGDWTLNSSLGRYYKIPPYTILGFKNNTGSFVNKSSEYIRTDHAVLGIEYLVNESSRITLEGFWKQYANYPVSVRDQVSLANKGGGFEVLGSEPVVSNGEGRTYGAELLFQQKFTGNFYGIAAFTLYKSEFTNGITDDYSPSVWDNNLLISLLGGYKLGKNWEVSARYRYLGKTPFAPVDETRTLANYPALIRDFTRIGEDELDPFSQVDIRVDKKWSFNNWSLDVFLEIQNALAQASPEEPQFGLARDVDGTLIEPQELVQVNLETEATVLPSIGLVVNF